jgi:hypothetical protein
MLRVVSGKFGQDVDIGKICTQKCSKRIRIWSKHQKELRAIKYTPISTDGVSIYNGSCKSFIRDYFNSHLIVNSINLIVLTSKEKFLILSEIVENEINLTVFEEVFTDVKNISYISNIEKQFNILKKYIIRKEKSIFKGNSFSNFFTNSHLYKIERKIRFKNGYDRIFALAYNGGYQEVFKLKEERKDRVIIALDFNSMYSSCMEGDFAEPKSLKYINLRDKQVSLDSLLNGLYRVKLIKPKDSLFFNNYHPFTYNICTKKFKFDLNGVGEIETLLFKNEVLFYSKYFEEVKLMECIISNKKIKHPLWPRAQREYKKRISYALNKDFNNERISKYNLLTMHSSSNTKQYIYRYFRNKEDILKHLELNYMVSFPYNLSNDEKILLLIKSDYFSLQKKGNGFLLKMINFSNNKAVYSLSAQVIANSRLKMIKTIEKLLGHNTVEICYANIDSIHISIKSENVVSFFKSFKGIISERLGDFKIQAISDRGYWFDVGRYWLFKDNNVNLYKNAIFNHKGSCSKFSRNRKIKIICENEKFKYVKSAYASIENAFTYHKRLQLNDDVDKIDCFRYRLEEIRDLDVAGETYNQEILNSRGIKISLFNKLATGEVL